MAERVINGIPVRSEYEWNVALALWRLKHEFYYQFEFKGGSRVRGGQILDFLVLSTVPLPTPILVHGRYWHRGQLGSEDAIKLAILEAETRASMNPVLIMWGNDCMTEQDAFDKLRREIGSG
jgi:hypothetical protein